MKPPFTFATDVMTVTTTEFSLDKAAAGRIAVMSGVDFSKHGRNERMGAQSESRGYTDSGAGGNLLYADKISVVSGDVCRWHTIDRSTRTNYPSAGEVNRGSTDHQGTNTITGNTRRS